MSADEEYLDNLLKSVTENLDTEDSEPESMQETDEEPSFDIDAMLKELDLLDVDLSVPMEEETISEPEGTEETIIPDQIFVDDMAELTEDDIDRMLEASQEDSSDISVPVDEPEMLDPDVDEINTLLEKADSNEAVSDEVFDLFAGMGSIGEDEETIEEPVDIIGEINSSETKKAQAAQKKAERDRKRQEKAARKIAKTEEKEKKKKDKADKTGKTDKTVDNADESVTEMPEKQYAEVDDSDEIDLFGVALSQEDSQADSISVFEAFSEPESQEKTEETEESEETEETFGTFEEVEEYTDIDDLLSSLSLDDFAETSVPSSVSQPSFSDSAPEEVDIEDADQYIDNKTVADKKDKSKKEKTKKEKNKKTKSEQKGDSEKSFFGKVIDFLTEEDEEEEKETPKKSGKNGTKDINAENDAIMEELDKEDKKSKKSGKKEKKNKKEDKKKPKKEKKPVSMSKKFKPIDDDKPEKKVGKKSILVICLIAISIFMVILLTDIIFSPILAKQRAREAFTAQDYENCYLELSGWSLNAEEENMRDFSMVIMKMERRITAYEQYRDLRQKTEALDSLLRAVRNYDEIYQEALNCGAEGEVEIRYDFIINLLAEEYHLSEKDAKYIALLNSDVEYTRYLTAVIEGETISDTKDDAELPELLPEEEELPDTKFSE